MTDAFPMFPLGSVLLPSMVLPLHVFEDRYRQLVDDVLAAPEPEFGVTLIERGSEVGGGDFRAMTGCVARIIEAGRTEDGRWALVTVGTRRVRVRQWLDDAPYPRALVEDWPDEGGVPVSDEVAEVESDLRRVAALGSELGLEGLPPDLELSEDPALATFQLAVLSPIGALDRQRVLETPAAEGRLALVRELLGEQEELFRAQLAFGDGPDEDGPS